MWTEVLVATVFGLLFFAGFYYVIYEAWRKNPENREKNGWPLLLGFVLVEAALGYFLVATT